MNVYMYRERYEIKFSYISMMCQIKHCFQNTPIFACRRKIPKTCHILLS